MAKLQAPPLSLLNRYRGHDFNRDPMDGLFVLTACTRIHLPGVEKAIAEERVRHTERYCPYTKMARNGITNIVALGPVDGKTKPGGS